MKIPTFQDVQRAVEAAPALDTFTENYAPGRNSIQVATPEELEAVLTHVVMHTCSYRDSEAGAQFIRGTVQHEQRHDEAARAVGAKVLGYGIHFFDGGSKLLAFHLSKPLRVPLLNAAIELYPEEPSPNDLKRAAKFGYTVAKVAEEAKRSNDTRGTTIPIPLSYKPAA